MPDFRCANRRRGRRLRELRSSGIGRLVRPEGTPKTAIDKINADVSKVLDAADGRERMGVFGFVPYTGAPNELTKAIERDSFKFGEVVKRAKISEN